MPILRTIKSDYEFFYHQKLDIIVALDAENRVLLTNFWKNNKGKYKGTTAKLKIAGFKLVLDEEFESLKIDFSQSFQFEAGELEKVK